MPDDAEAAARRKANRERAQAAADAEIDMLSKHLHEVDARLSARERHKEAMRQKRLHDEYDPTPTVRKMFQDSALAVAAQIPGPGTYDDISRSTRVSCSSHALKDGFGTTFAKSEGRGPELDWKLSARLAEPSSDARHAACACV